MFKSPFVAALLGFALLSPLLSFPTTADANPQERAARIQAREARVQAREQRQQARQQRILARQNRQHP